MAFIKATKAQAKARIALIGPGGSGKSYTALIIAGILGNKVAAIDTERGSLSKYSDKFNFDVSEFDSYNPANYIKAIEEAAAAGYDTLIIDSLSHAWAGKDGSLELVEKEKIKQRNENQYTAWRNVTPLHNRLIDAILQAPMHVIVTMRTKTEYVLESNEKGKMQPRKVGLAPIMRDGIEYEFDVVADIDIDHNLVVTKTRCDKLDGYLANKPGSELANILKSWLSDGVPAVDKRKSTIETKSENKEESDGLTRSLQLYDGHMFFTKDEFYQNKVKGKIDLLTTEQKQKASEYLQTKEKLILNLERRWKIDHPDGTIEDWDKYMLENYSHLNLKDLKEFHDKVTISEVK